MKRIFVLSVLLLPALCYGSPEILFKSYMQEKGIADIKMAYVEFTLDKNSGPEEYLWVSRQFAACNAAAWALANASSRTDQEAKEHYLHQVGNGANFAGKILNSWAGYKEGMYESRLDTWISYWESSGGPFSKESGITSDFLDSMQKCSDLEELQAVIVDHFRREAYKMDGPKDPTENDQD